MYVCVSHSQQHLRVIKDDDTYGDFHEKAGKFIAVMTDGYRVSIYKDVFWKRVILFDAYTWGRSLYEETQKPTNQTPEE